MTTTSQFFGGFGYKPDQFTPGYYTGAAATQGGLQTVQQIGTGGFLTPINIASGSGFLTGLNIHYQNGVYPRSWTLRITIDGVQIDTAITHSASASRTVQIVGAFPQTNGGATPYFTGPWVG